MIRIPTVLLPVFLLLPMAVAGPDLCHAAAPDALPVAKLHGVDVGIAGHYKNGCWTPVHVTFSAGKARTLRLETVDPDGVAVWEDFPITEDEGSRRLYTRLGRASAPLRVSLRDEEGQTLDGLALTPAAAFKEASRRKADPLPGRFAAPVPMNRPLYLIIGEDNIGLLDAVSELRLQENLRPVLVRVESLDDLPDRAKGYEAFDLVVLTTSQPEFFDDLQPDAPALAALEEWLHSGGQVFFVAGRDAEPLLRAANETSETPVEAGALSRFLPGRFRGMSDVRQGELLQIFAGSRRPLVMTGSEETPFLRVPLFDKEPGGVVLLRDGSLPLVMRVARGFGTLTYLGGDLHADPLLSWQDRGLLIATVFGWKQDRDRGVGAAPSTSLMHFGYEDVAGQLRSALDVFDGVAPVRFSLILTVLAVYVLAVGGFDWLLVRKLLKNPQWTRLSYPLWLLLFCVIAWVLGSGNRLDEATVNRVDLLDYDTVQGRTRLSSWYALYSPVDARYNLETAMPDGCLTWNGLSGSGLGGMAPKTFTPGVWNEGYAAVSGTLHDMPVAVRSTKSLVARGRFDLPVGTANTTNTTNTSDPSAADTTGGATAVRLREAYGIPVGEIVNPFDFPLDEARLAFGRWVLDIGRIDAGAGVSVGSHNPRSEIRTALYDRLSEESVFQRSVASYQVQSKDVFYILRALTWHDAAGGYDALGLTNRYQGDLEMSHLLKADRAVLIARAPDGDFGVLRSGTGNGDVVLRTGRRDTVVRLVLPVVLAEKKERPKEDDGVRSGLDPATGTGPTEHYELPQQ